MKNICLTLRDLKVEETIDLVFMALRYGYIKSIYINLPGGNYLLLSPDTHGCDNLEERTTYIQLPLLLNLAITTMEIPVLLKTGYVWEDIKEPGHFCAEGKAFYANFDIVEDIPEDLLSLEESYQYIRSLVEPLCHRYDLAIECSDINNIFNLRYLESLTDILDSNKRIFITSYCMVELPDGDFLTKELILFPLNEAYLGERNPIISLDTLEFIIAKTNMSGWAYLKLRIGYKDYYFSIKLLQESNTIDYSLHTKKLISLDKINTILDKN